MSPRITCPELFGVTAHTITLAFDVEDDAGPIDAPARVRVDGEVRAESHGASATRLVRIEGLEPDREHVLDIEVAGAAPARRDAGFPERVRTLPAAASRASARFATLNDLHFGEVSFGGAPEPGAGGDGRPDAEYPRVHESEGEDPYWLVMNQDAIADINAAGVDCAVIKGDIADRGRAEQFEIARRTFERFEMPHHAFLGNHDGYARNEGEEVDGLELLGQPPMPRVVELGGWHLILIDTVELGETPGFFPDERRAWLAARLEDARDAGAPVLVFSHHQPVPAEHAHTFPNTIGLRPDHSLPLIELIGKHPQVRAMLIGHTHQNRVRRYAAAPLTPFVEVSCVKDYPGSWAHYELFEDGSFRQEVRRTSSARALAHSRRCRDFFGGGYRRFALGKLSDRSFAVTG